VRVALRCEALENRCTPATFTVNTTADTVDANPAVTSLREAITAANVEGGTTQHTINFDPAIHNKGIALQSHLPDITANVYIDGPGRTLMSVNRGTTDTFFRLFKVGTGSITTIARLTLADGDIGTLPSGGGGAIVSNGQLTVTDCLIRNNRAADAGGGAIYAGDGRLDVNNCHFFQNQAENGGAVYAIWGVPVAVTGGKFEQNVAEYWGGAIHGAGDFGGVAQSITVSGVEITNNTAGNGGAGIAAIGKSTLTLTGATNIHHNTVSVTNPNGKGGGVYISGGTINYNGVRIADNNAAKGDGVYLVWGVVRNVGPGGVTFEGKPMPDQEVWGS
jgi:CSLREA domain-containing protein